MRAANESSEQAPSDPGVPEHKRLVPFTDAQWVTFYRQDAMYHGIRRDDFTRALGNRMCGRIFPTTEARARVEAMLAREVRDALVEEHQA